MKDRGAGEFEPIVRLARALYSSWYARAAVAVAMAVPAGLGYWYREEIPSAYTSAQETLLSALGVGVTLVPIWLAVFLLAVAMLAIALRGLRTEAALVAAVTVSAYILRVALKLAIARPRPTDDLVRVVDQADGYSFPSGHVMYYVVFLGMLGVVLWDERRPGPGRWLLVAAVGVLLALIGLSRVYLGAHWPSDVLGGYVFGGAVLGAAVWVRRSFAFSKHDRGRHTGTAPTN